MALLPSRAGKGRLWCTDFDRQALEILLEEGAEEEHSFVYEPDTANSGYHLQDAIEGWRVRDMRFEAETADYATSFGDPAAPGPNSRFSRLRVVLSLERSDYSGFFKLTAALYAGFLICAIGCLMHVTATTFAPRITLLAASLFAIVVNMRRQPGTRQRTRHHPGGRAPYLAVLPTSSSSQRSRCWSGSGASGRPTRRH